jgi:hypothetical protein
MRAPSVTWGYALLVAALVAAAALKLPFGTGPRAPEVGFERVATQPFFGLVPEGLPRLDLRRLRSSMDRLGPVQLMRQAGNSLRVAAGQGVEWITWGGREPLMLFPNTDLWVSWGLSPYVATELAAFADRVAEYDARLAAEGWTLVVVPVPTKIGIHRELATWPVREGLLSRSEVAFDRTDEVYGYLVAALRKRSIATVDLQSAFRASVREHPSRLLYVPGDAHWTGAGIELAADTTIAEVARHTRLRPHALAQPSYSEFHLVPDLVHVYDVLEWLPGRLSSIYETHIRVTDADAGKGYDDVPAHPEALLATAGSSYSLYYTNFGRHRVAFPWQLGLRLENVEVQTYAEFGQLGRIEPFWRAREAIVRDFEARHGARLPRAVVWEFPLRDTVSLRRLLPAP